MIGIFTMQANASDSGSKKKLTDIPYFGLLKKLARLPFGPGAGLDDPLLDFVGFAALLAGATLAGAGFAAGLDFATSVPSAALAFALVLGGGGASSSSTDSYSE